MPSDDLRWAIERVEVLAKANRDDAGRLGTKVLKGHGYPNEVMSYALDALAMETVLAAISAPGDRKVPPPTPLCWAPLPHTRARCDLARGHVGDHCSFVDHALVWWPWVACQCEAYETCDKCRGTDRDLTPKAPGEPAPAPPDRCPKCGQQSCVYSTASCTAVTGETREEPRCVCKRGEWDIYCPVHGTGIQKPVDRDALARETAELIYEEAHGSGAAVDRMVPIILVAFTRLTGGEP